MIFGWSLSDRCRCLFHDVAPAAKAYYRAGIPSTDGYTGTVTAAKFAGRTVTRITGFAISPRQVAKNRYFTISGTLQKYQSGWKGLTNQRVYIDLRLKGGKTWYWLVRVTTNAKGHFTAKVKFSRSAYWLPVFEGATGYYASAPSGSGILVTVR